MAALPFLAFFPFLATPSSSSTLTNILTSLFGELTAAKYAAMRRKRATTGRDLARAAWVASCFERRAAAGLRSAEEPARAEDEEEEARACWRRGVEGPGAKGSLGSEERVGVVAADEDALAKKLPPPPFFSGVGGVGARYVGAFGRAEMVPAKP